MRKIIIWAAGLAASHKALATSVVAGVAAAAPPIAVGEDWKPWAIGFAGGAFVYLRGDSVTRAQAFGNVMLSTALGGLVAPLVGVAVADKYEFNFPGTHLLLALVLGWGWPWIVRDVWPLISGRIKQILGGGNV